MKHLLGRTAWLGAAGAVALAFPALAHASEGGAGHAPPIPWVIPFVLLLLSIAVFPLWKPHWWEHNSNKLIVALAMGLPVTGYLLVEGHYHELLHALIEYGQFIVLLGSLYYVSGGIVVRGDLKATPTLNTGVLALGSLIASFVGTTGASMLLIRPLLKTNAERHHVRHTFVFFIFLVSNIGGCLTPLGDPPLFLGFLRGVPFTWTFSLWKEWLFLVVLLLMVYYIWDSRVYASEEKEDLAADKSHIEPLSVSGRINFALLAGVVACVAFAPTPYREGGMLFLCLLSRQFTAQALRAENKFTLHPIAEVAALFIGIFLAMVPAIMLLHVHGPDLGLDTPRKFFWGTGLLSSFLDNAPTYVTFFETAKTITEAGAITVAGVSEHFLTAISLGAVFMGANTYIGNGPNFMVKAVCEEAGVKMPTFFGYLLYSGAILIPCFVAVTFLFL